MPIHWLNKLSLKANNLNRSHYGSYVTKENPFYLPSLQIFFTSVSSEIVKTVGTLKKIEHCIKTCFEYDLRLTNIATPEIWNPSIEE